MSRLDLAVFGPLQILREGEPVDGPRYDKARALLVFLAAESDREHRRESLAGMFWPEQDEAAARHSLSQALWNLRQAVERDSDLPLLRVSRATVRFDPAGNYRLDVDQFRRLFDACERHPHRRLESCRLCVERLEQAVDLYRG